MQLRISTSIFLLLLHLHWIVPAPAQDESISPREKLWWEAAELLQRREYSLAVNRLENELTDPTFYPHKAGIQEDLNAVKQVLALSEVVTAQSRKLQPGAKIVLLDIPHRFKQLKSDRTGNSLVLLTSSGKEVVRPLKEIDATMWLTLAEPITKNWEKRDLALAVFLGFDRYQDVKQARKHLNAAAEHDDVVVWLSRLEEAEVRRRAKRVRPEKENTNGDRFIGSWRVVLNKNVRLNFNIRKGGRATIRGQKGRVFNAKWVEESGETIRLTGEQGGTFLIHVSQDRIFGETAAGGKFRGVRIAGG